MPDLNEQVTLLRRAPRPFSPSGGSNVPLSFLVWSIGGRHEASLLRFQPFNEGATVVSVQAGLAEVKATTTPPPGRSGRPATVRIASVQGSLPAGTLIRFNTGGGSFVIRTTASWAPMDIGQSRIGQDQPLSSMSIVAAPGGIDSVTDVEIATDVDYLPGGRGAPTVTSTAVYWGALRDYSVGEDVDERGNQFSVSNAEFLLRYDASIAADENIVNATLTDSLSRDWDVVGVELEPGARLQYMTLKVTRR